MLRPRLGRETADFDVFHLQFGFDACDPRGPAASSSPRSVAGASPWSSPSTTCATPTTATARAHDAQLDVLVPAADAVITLTPGAAGGDRAPVGRGGDRACRTRTSSTSRRRARCARARARGPWTVGLHVKSLRASMDPMRRPPDPGRAGRRDCRTPCCRSTATATCSPRTARAATPGWRRWLRDAAARGDLDLRIHDYLSDDELWSYLAALDVSVLPYRFGTHSGWLEACRDLGTTVVAPDCGYFADQGPILTYAMDEDRFDADSLRAALHAARDRPAAPGGPGGPGGAARRASPRRTSPSTGGCSREAAADLHHRLQQVPHPGALRRRPRGAHPRPGPPARRARPRGHAVRRARLGPGPGRSRSWRSSSSRPRRGERSDTSLPAALAGCRSTTPTWG